MGRPLLLTPELHSAIVESVRGGNYRTTAAAASGIHRSTLYDWLERGERGEEPFASFARDMERAEAESEQELVGKVRGARAAVVGVSGPDLWQAWMTLLERRHPKRWSARVRQTVDEELASLMRRLESKLDEDTFAKVIHATREDASEPADDTRH